MKKHTITEKEYIEMVDAMNTLSGENQKLRGFIDGMREQLLINGVSHQRELLPKRLSNEAYTMAKGTDHATFTKWWDMQKV